MTIDLRPPEHVRGPSPREVSNLPWTARTSRRVVSQLFASADVTVGGDRPWDIQVHDHRAFGKILSTGSLGFGESYVDSWWSTEDLEALVYRLCRARLHIVARLLPSQLAAFVAAQFTNHQDVVASRTVAEQHYDMGNDLFCALLGRYMNYSCGYFEETSCLDEAQCKKLDLICRRLRLTESDHLLDVGGGWGQLAHHAASRYGCRVTSINISEEQIRYARALCHGLPVEVQRCDYRAVTGSYDKIAVIAMLTHVGPKNYEQFFSTMDRCLRQDGLMLIETLGSRWPKATLEPWTNTYIFPGGVVPSLGQVERASTGRFETRELEEFGRYYLTTVRAWHANVVASWPTLSRTYPDRVRLMLEYFLLSVAGAFRAGHLKYWHVLLAKRTGRPG